MSAPLWGSICRWPSILSPPVATCRYPSAVPAGSAVAAVLGLEDEDEDEDENPPISYPVAFANDGTKGTKGTNGT
ncbi:MAG: hypothetical protein ACOYD3_12400 [Kiritimatiellia bacterium]